MKNLFIFPFFAFLVFFNLNAQSTKGDITLAPQIGLNFSTYTSDASYDLRTSFAGGVIGEYYFSDRWSLRSGLLFDPMGAEDDFNNTDKLNYLSLPLQANWHFGKNRNWFLNFGPYAAFLLSANSELSDGQEIDVKDFVSKMDIGFGVGIGYKFDVSENLQLSIDYQGYGGFINIDDSDSLPFDITNSRSSFNVGAIFKI